MIHTKLRKQIQLRMKKLKDQKLYGWERNFYRSFKNSSSLTERQLSTLTKIEDRLRRENEERQVWLNEWNYEKQLNFELACRYYQSVGCHAFYIKHKSVILKGIKNPNDFVPTRKQYRMIAENKYVQKAIRAYFDVSKYNVGDLVYVVGEYGYKLLNDNKWVGLIIHPATKEFTKKEKKYLVKPISKVTFSIFYGFSEDRLISERFLLSYRGVS
jgi:hypothetical protein